MTKYQILGAALVLSAAVATPALAEVVQEPGLYSFYHPNSDLGLGPTRSTQALASAERSDLRMSVRIRHISRAPAIKRY